MTRAHDTQDCQCCAGTDASTPARVDNPPGLSEIRYRVGRHGEFLDSMKARLSSTDYPALATLSTRDGSDFTLAIADAMASMLDGLSFYTERYAQEHYLRTATERRSVVDMARLIGYRPAPGVAASTHLAFTLTSAPGIALDPITIPVGTRVQSVPGQDETAQTFETVEAVPARAQWNAIPVQQTRALKPAFGDRSLWLQGTNTGLSIGDTILIVGAEQNKDPQAERWDVRTIQRITVDQLRQLTRVDWQVGLGHTKPFVLPAEQAVRIYTFRKRTSVFGANAPDWKVLGEEAKLGYLGIKSPGDAQAAYDASEWPDFSALAPAYPERRTSGGIITQHAPATTIEAVMAAATSAAHTTADSAMHRAATSGIGVLGALVRQPDTIDISPTDDKVVTQSWALLSVPQSVELYRVTAAGVASRSEYLLSGQTTRLTLSGELPDGRLPDEFEHAPRALSVQVQSEELPLAATPVAAPVYGQILALDRREDALAPGQPLALIGTRQRIRIVAADKDISFQADDGSERTLAEGDSLQLVAPPVRLVPATLTLSYYLASLSKRFKPKALGMSSGSSFNLKTLSPGATTYYTPVTLAPETFTAFLGNASIRLRLRVLDRDGATGTVSLRADDIVLEAARKDDEVVREIVFVGDAVDSIEHDRDRSTLTLAAATTHVYVRLGTAVNANVAPATHGESVAALLGDGDGSAANQRFVLNQAPLTYVSAATPSGRASTLEVRVNDILWEEAATLYNADSRAHLFETAQDDDGITTLRFGDGIEGARLPGGSSNVRARYRKGIGVGGNVGRGKLTTLLSRPPGVSEVTNPSPATGGEDPETLDQARDNAPLTVLTLDRAVSIVDYANFARAFAGIEKAHALWIPSGPARGVFVTVAGIGGASVPATGKTHNSLLDALTTYGDPLMPIRLADYRDARFQLRIAVLVDAAFEQASVLDAVGDTLSAHFAFARRDFGQTVSIDEVAAVAQGVSGVVAVHVRSLHRVGQSAKANARLFAQLPVATIDGLPLSAEMLTPADDGIVVEVMQ